MNCSENGKSGWKYGNSGRCYTGPGGKKKAIKQGVAESYNSGEKFKAFILSALYNSTKEVE